MDETKIKAAMSAVTAARVTLQKTLASWDESVSTMHMSWLDVRRAERKLQEAEAILQYEVHRNGRDVL